MSLETVSSETVCPSELETDITDITITPDGRIRCFGLSRQLLALLCETGLADEQLQHHWHVIQQHSTDNNTVRTLNPSRDHDSSNAIF